MTEKEGKNWRHENRQLDARHDYRMSKAEKEYLRLWAKSEKTNISNLLRRSIKALAEKENRTLPPNFFDDEKVGFPPGKTAALLTV